MSKVGRRKKHVTIVGAGPAGSLQACYLARRGYKVDLYESRKDIRKDEGTSGKSINLALSKRGIDALKGVGLDKRVVEHGLPMRARMIHMKDGSCYPVPYGKKGEYLLSISRLTLNQKILDAAANHSNVKVYFQHKMTSCDLDEPRAHFTRKSDGETVTSTPSCLFGCDGAHSGVRAQMKRGIFDYSQKYIPHAYKELSIPAGEDGQFKIEPGHLHIWPRHQYMMIALPNLDKSWTLTLFMPFKVFQPLTDAGKVINFFKEVFPDALPLIGEERLIDDFFQLPPLPLITVKCNPYHYKDTAALIGDAAHSVVPFFGQGLNASLEDVLIFDGIMDKHNDDFGKVLTEYSDVRTPDGQAIADLSEQNYIEMRSDVASTWFLFRKKVDTFLNFLLPAYFVPRYTMVSFTRTRYHHVVEKSNKQNKIVNTCFLLLSILLIIYFYRFLTRLLDASQGIRSYL